MPPRGPPMAGALQPPDFTAALAAPNDQMLVLSVLQLIRPTRTCLRPPTLAAVAACGGAACTTSLGLKAQIDKHLEEFRASCPEYFQFLVGLRAADLGAAAALPACPIHAALELAHLSVLFRRLARPLLFAVLEMRHRRTVKDDHLDGLLRGVGEEGMIPKRQR